jgi:hypothetical protein
MINVVHYCEATLHGKSVTLMIELVINHRTHEIINNADSIKRSTIYGSSNESASDTCNIASNK